MKCADAVLLGILYYKEKACGESDEVGVLSGFYVNSQLATVPKRTPNTKSQTVIAIMIETIVRYSSLFTRFRVSQSASFTRSIPSTKIRAPTSITA